MRGSHRGEKEVKKEMAYQLRSVNASACAMEQAAPETLGEGRYTDFVKTAITSGIREETNWYKRKEK